MTNDSCIFCKIISGELPCHKIWEDEDYLAFLDIRPLTPGHTLLIPKKHFQDLLSMNAQFLQTALAKTQMIVKLLITKLEAKGMNILQSNGREAGQVVDHIHFHLIPRYFLSELSIENDPNTAEILSNPDYFTKTLTSLKGN